MSALASACCFALSTSLQHRAAGQEPGGRLMRLVRRPAWPTGAALGGCGFLLHAVALRGALTVVQPLLVSGLVFALPVRALLDRRAPSWPVVGWAVLLACGLALFTVTVRAEGQALPDEGLAALLVLTGVTMALAVTGSAGRATGPRRQALLLGLTTGILFGFTAALLKMVTAAVSTEGPAGAVNDWSLFVLLRLGTWGLTVNQRAYSVASLAVPMPVPNIVAPLVAIAFGMLVFGERPAAGSLPCTPACGLSSPWGWRGS
jgi:hypothetical protein